MIHLQGVRARDELTSVPEGNGRRERRAVQQQCRPKNGGGDEAIKELSGHVEGQRAG
jgi:hypothetical protein